VVEGALHQFGKDATQYQHDVIFLNESFAAKIAMKSVSVIDDGVDRIYEEKGVLSISCTL
jgi:hypothetical protein